MSAPYSLELLRHFDAQRIRCGFSDLILGQCALPCCRPELAHQVAAVQPGAPETVAGRGAELDQPVGRIVRWAVAGSRSIHAGFTCSGCAERVKTGVRVAYTADGDWVCEDCATGAA